MLLLCAKSFKLLQKMSVSLFFICRNMGRLGPLFAYIIFLNVTGPLGIHLESGLNVSFNLAGEGNNKKQNQKTKWSGKDPGRERETTHEVSGAAGPMNNQVCHVSNDVRGQSQVEEHVKDVEKHFPGILGVQVTVSGRG